MVILRCLFSTRFTLVFFLTFFLFFILYNSVGDDMKKYIGSIVLSIIFGIYLGMFVLNQYKDLNVISVFDYYDSLFFLQSGVYSSEESMKDEMSSFPYYIYDIDDPFMCDIEVYEATFNEIKESLEKIDIAKLLRYDSKN